ncbi:MAG: glycosyltransferase family 39 protein [Anaerolineae bacterium]|nr:glycosyltransferase family 39 protein [Anaerolineae bacterium]
MDAYSGTDRQARMIDLYWLRDTLFALPLALLIYVGVGVPWALIVLPRRDWRLRMLVIALAFALGPALVTAWLFVLGTLGASSQAPLLRFDLSLMGILVLAVVGIGLGWRKLRRTTAEPAQHIPWSWDEKLLITLIGTAIIVRFVVTAYWPFTAYDALWVYGFQGRLYLLDGFIPQTIGYYPQFMQLQYAFMQMSWGGFNDHAARAILPFLHFGSIAAAYSLGRLLFTRRVALFTAAIWALYPHMGDWARIGDLEIPLAFLFTLSAALFLYAWSMPTDGRRRYAILAGLVFGVAMWTKPTAGAFVWGVVLLVVVELVRGRFNWRGWWPRFEVAALTGLACIPLGGVWYVRNITLGLPALVFPHFSWLDRATQSGDLFSWPLLALTLLLIYLFTRPHKPDWRLVLPGFLLVLVALVPSMPDVLRAVNDAVLAIQPDGTGIDLSRIDPPASRLMLHEWALLALGVGLIGFALYRYARPIRHESNKQPVQKIVWALLLALPYFLTFFYSYSYHARLSFAIVPLLILPSAVILTYLFPEAAVTRWSVAKKMLVGLAVIVIALPGILIAWSGAAVEDDWLWTNRYPDDNARYAVHNPSIMLLKTELDRYIAEEGREPVIIAPGEQRLHFFYPLMTIEEFALPTQLDELAGATHYLYGAQARWRYADAEIAPGDNQVVSALARPEIFTRTVYHTDASFRYELYEINLVPRFVEEETNDTLNVGYLYPQEVVFGEGIRLVGEAPSARQLRANTLYLHMVWQAVGPIDEDYMMAFSLYNADDDTIYGTWTGPVSPGEHGYYRTNLWSLSEYVRDQRRFELSTLDGYEDFPDSLNYQIRVSVYDPETGEALPMQVDGELTEGGFPLFSPFYVGGE